MSKNTDISKVSIPDPDSFEFCSRQGMGGGYVRESRDGSSEDLQLVFRSILNYLTVRLSLLSDPPTRLENFGLSILRYVRRGSREEESDPFFTSKNKRYDPFQDP